MCRLRRCAPVRVAICFLLPAAGFAMASAGCAVTPAEPPSTGSIPGPATASSVLSRMALVLRVADTARPLSHAEADAVMARAIAEHEMRQP
jgi:hypothetical protein